MPDRALTPTARRVKCTMVEAEVYARETVQQLEDRMFAESIQMRDGWFDVYGCYRDGLGWYVKVRETDDGALVISHHEPEYPLNTKSELIVEFDPAAPPARGTPDEDDA